MTDITELNERSLEEILSKPSEATKEILSVLDGDIVVLGAGGKMGPTISMMLKMRQASRRYMLFPGLVMRPSEAG